MGELDCAITRGKERGIRKLLKDEVSIATSSKKKWYTGTKHQSYCQACIGIMLAA